MALGGHFQKPILICESPHLTNVEGSLYLGPAFTTYLRSPTGGNGLQQQTKLSSSVSRSLETYATGNSYPCRRGQIHMHRNQANCGWEGKTAYHVYMKKGLEYNIGSGFA